jgi:PAS domain S-box-containing protein
MTHREEAQIGRLFFGATTLIVTFFALSLTGFFVFGQYRDFAAASRRMEETFMADQRDRLKREVHRALDFVRREQERMDRQIRTELREQTQKGRAVARAILAETRGRLSRPEIEVLIRESLRDIRFNDGRGYFFIDHIDGTCVLLPIAPWMEGADFWDNQDDTGHFILREFVQIVLEKGEGFSTYRWYPPGDTANMQEKISFVTLFEPFEWIIGTGEYRSDASAGLQDRLLEQLSEIRFGDTGTFSVLGADGTILAPPSAHRRVGTNALAAENPEDREIAETLLEAGQNGGQFHRYPWFNPRRGRPTPKLAYVERFPEWGWTLIGGVYLDSLEAALREKRTELEAEVRREMGVAVLLFLAATAAAAFLSFLLSRKAEGMFDAYRSRLTAGSEELARATAELDRRRRELREVVDLVPHQIYARDAEGRFRMANRATAHFYERTPEELIGHSLADLHPDPAESAALVEKDRQVLESGAPREFSPEPGWRPGDTPGIFQSWSIPFPDPETGSPGVLGIRMDMTERRRSEREARRLRTAVEQAFDAVLITDPDGRIEYVNPAFETISGHPMTEVVGQTPRFLQSGEHPGEFYRDLRETMAAGRPWRGRIINRRKDGGLFHVETTISPARDPDGRLAHFVSIQRDITHEVALERELRQSQKMEAIGALAGGIAHDFNNILFPILGYTEMTLDELSDNDPARENLLEIHRAVNRARDLIGQILTFSRMDARERRPIRLTPIIKESLKLLRASIPTTIAIETHIPAETPPVMADPTRIQQVLINLCTNAYHAMRDRGGRLTIRLEERRAERDDGAPAGLPPGKRVRLSVSDTGVGMAPDVVEKIFDPYFTTRQPGDGTGMGLAMVHGIVKDLDGEITVHSQPGAGTTFRVWLPAVDSAPSPEDDPPAPFVDGGAEHILLVDDEAAISEMIRLVLTRLGYTVSAFTHPDEALAAFHEAPTLVDLLITDMTMPGRTGLDLARRVRRRRPDLPVIICTGYADAISTESAAADGVDELLVKPVGKDELAAAVRRVLANGGAAPTADATG